MRLGFRALSAVAPGLAARAAQKIWFTPTRRRAGDDSRAILSTAERFELIVDGRAVVAWRWGQGSGPTVILVHGWGGYGGQMQAFVEPLTRAGFQVLTFDAPAHGESGPSRLGARRATLFDFADAFQALTRQTTSLAGVVAHSGGCTAVALALRSSPNASLHAMVFIAPMASPAKYRRMFQTSLGLSDDAMRRFASNTERQFGFRWEQLEVPEMAAHMRTPPTLVIHDRDDRETSWSDGAAIAAAWPGARLHTTIGLGHVRILRDPAVVEDAVRFLKAQSPGRRSGGL